MTTGKRESERYSFLRLKGMAAHLLRERSRLSADQIANGLKMFNIAFLNADPEDTDLDRHQAFLLLTIVHRECTP
jgi:hypothetical protein